MSEFGGIEGTENKKDALHINPQRTPCGKGPSNQSLTLRGFSPTKTLQCEVLAMLLIGFVAGGANFQSSSSTSQVPEYLALEEYR